jgi:carboxymethylenebutenolidase
MAAAKEGQTIELITPDGPMPAFVATPAGDAKGGVVVIQEAFGLTPHIESIVARLAEAGFVAVAPAMFHRSGSPTFDYGDWEKIGPAFASMTAEGIGADVSAAIDHLGTLGFSVEHCGVVGFCMGGTVALMAGTEHVLGAAVTFYGGGVTTGRFGFPPLVEAAPNLRSPWLGLFGDEDQGIPVDDVEALREAAAAAKVDTQVVRYAGAGHGFNNDEREDAYHAASAVDAWRRMLAWFDSHL